MSSHRNFLTHLLLLFSLAVVAALIYGQTMDDEWHLDDLAELNRPGVRGIAPVVGSDYYRGLVVLYVWALDYRMSGEEVGGYHLTNLILHVVNAFLVYWMAWLLAGMVGEGDAGWGIYRRFVAWTAALLFCVHPLATQAVSYITQRSTELATLFLLVSCCCYFASRSGEKPLWGRAAFLVLGLALFAVGLYSKHLVLMVPVVLVMFEWMFAARTKGGWKPGLAAVAPFFILLVLRMRMLGWSLAPLWKRITASAEAAELGQEVADVGARNAPVMISSVDYLYTQFRVIARYIRLLIVPTGQNLDYDYPTYHSLTEPAVLSSLVLILILLAGALLLRKRSPLCSFGILFFFIALVPTSSFIRAADVIFEHRAYAGLAGFALVVACAMIHLGSWLGRHGMAAGPKRLWIATIILGIVLGGLAFSRTRVWDTELSLWTDAAAKSPGKVRPHHNLGLALQEAGRTDEAVEEYLKVVELCPNHPHVHNNLGNAYREQGRLVDALREILMGLEIEPECYGAYSNLGNVYTEMGRFPEAEEAYEKALAGDPENLSAQYNLGKLYERQDRHAEAVGVYGSLVRAEPDDPVFLNALGCAYHESGENRAAEETLRKALAIDPASDLVHHNLGLVYESLGRDPDAVREYERAIEISPQRKESLNNLGVVFMRVGRPEEAEAAWRKALMLDPSFEPALENLRAWGRAQSGPRNRE